MTATGKQRLRAIVTDRRFARWIGFAVAGGALLATGARLADSQEKEVVTNLSPLLPADPVSAELARCRAITDPAAVDDACRAAWAENRRRFLSLDKAQNRLAPATAARPSAAPKDE
jgi:conjugative transfer region protein TrbK